MILRKDEIKTLLVVFKELAYEEHTEDERRIWNKLHKELDDPGQDVKLRPKDLAFRWSMNVKSIENMRKLDRGPRYMKLKTGTIRYDLVDVENYERLRAITPKHPL